MNDVRSELRRLADRVPVGPPPLEAMTAGARQHHRSRWVAPLVAAASVAVVVAGVTVLGSRHRANGPADPDATVTTNVHAWRKLPTPPLSPRSQAISAYVAGRVLVVGGMSTTFEGGMPRGQDLRDGAAYDPTEGTWQKLAELPRSLDGWGYTSVVVGDELVLPMQRGRWLAYDVGDGAWRTLPAPPRRVEEPSLAADDGHIYAAERSDVAAQEPIQVLDVATRHWSALPRTGREPLLDLRSLVTTDAGLVVVGVPGDYHHDHVGARPVAAELWDGRRWSRTTASAVAGADFWWSGTRVVSGYRLTEREARHDRPHQLPAGAFDPQTRTWSAVPWLPSRDFHFARPWTVPVEGTRAFAWGWLYDDATGKSTRVRSPSAWSDGAVVLTDDALVVVGGQRPKPGQEPGARVTNLDLTNEAWLLPLD